MNWQEAMSAIADHKKVKRHCWDKMYLSIFLTYADLVWWRKHPDILNMMDADNRGCIILDSMTLFSFPLKVSFRWHPSQEDLQATDWEIAYPKKKTCQICDKVFNYGDEQSPVFTDEIWAEIFRFYEIPLIPEYNGYICYKCAETALGRKINMSDLKEVPFNYAFIRFYFKNDILKIALGGLVKPDKNK